MNYNYIPEPITKIAGGFITQTQLSKPSTEEERN